MSATSRAKSANRNSQIIEEKKREHLHVTLDFSFLRDKIEKGGLMVQTFKCPNCSANIQFPDQGASVKCQYCGSIVHAEDIFEKIKSLIGA